MPDHFIPVIATTVVSFVGFSAGLAYAQFITGPWFQAKERVATQTSQSERRAATPTAAASAESTAA